MDVILGILLGLFVMTVLVVIHELGHALVAKKNNVKVKEFGIGFPPKAKSKKLKDSILGKNVEFSLNWLPLGGFVRLKGEYDSSKEKNSYGASCYWVKTKILFAGVAMNWLVAIVLFTILAWMGLPKIIDNQFTVASDTKIETIKKSQVAVAKVLKNSPAEKAGLKSMDIIKKVDNKEIKNYTTFTEIAEKNANKDINLEILRSGETKNIVVKPELNDKTKKGFVGVGLGQTRQKDMIHATWSAPIVGVGTTAQLTWVTLTSLGDMVGKLSTGLINSFNSDEGVRKEASQKIDQVSQNVAGPVGLLGVIFPEAGKAGIVSILFISAVISLSLAVMNALPIPALDGGRWATMTIFKLLKKPLTKEREENIQAIGMMILFGLIILITFADIGKVL